MGKGCKQGAWEGEGLQNQCLDVAPSPRHTTAFVKPHNPSFFFHQCCLI